MRHSPLVLFIPGLRPKPEPEWHRQALRRCLEAGLAKADADVAAEFSADAQAFDIVSWAYDFYGEHRDSELDAPCIELLLQKNAADETDQDDANSWQRRLLRKMYYVGDHLPFLIPKLANKNVALHLRDLRRYVKNVNDAADNTRRLLKTPLKSAAAASRPVLLLAHSMGSVIAWDSLWQLSRDRHYNGTLSLLMTLGSPLGQRYIQQRVLGSQLTGIARYPTVIERWINLAAVGELTAVDMTMADDFASMKELGLVQSIEDHAIWNWYREDGQLKVHAEYGYLANRDTAKYVAAWWRAHREKK